MTAATLFPIPRQPWPAMLGGLPVGHRWLWSDLDGIHLCETLPAAAPEATHVWGWQYGASWVRLRLEGSSVRGARLVLGAPAGGSRRMTVDADLRGTLLWDDTRVDPRWADGTPPALREDALRVIRCQHPGPLTFLEIAR